MPAIMFDFSFPNVEDISPAKTLHTKLWPGPHGHSPDEFAWSDMVLMGFVWSSGVQFVTFVMASKGGWVLLGRQCNRDQPSCLSPSDMQSSGCTLFTSWQRVQRTRILSPVCFPWPEVITKYTSVPCCRSQLSKDGWMSKDGTHPFQRLHRAVLDGCAALVCHLNHTRFTPQQQDVSDVLLSLSLVKPWACCAGRACQGGVAVWALRTGCRRPRRSGCETGVWGDMY